LFLSVPQPYDFMLSTERFRVFGLDPANLWHVSAENRGGLHRVVDGREVRVEPVTGGVDMAPDGDGLANEVAHLLGLPFDVGAFLGWARADPVLHRLTRALNGFRPPLAPDPFEALVTSVTAQQVSLRSAFAIRARFVQRFGIRATFAFEFPTRERVAAAREEELMELGFSRRKAEYVLGLARAELDFRDLDQLPDEQVVARIVSVRGLGEWTADWYLARHLGRPHAWPAGDLALRKAVRIFYGQVDDVRLFGARLHPFQNLSAQYLLAALRLPTPQ
jgi:DNA-3-methyladenine glycosylase II